MTKELPTWKERFDERFTNNDEYLHELCTELEMGDPNFVSLRAFIEQEIIEAERRMKERCLECIPGEREVIKDASDEEIAHTKGYNWCRKSILNSIKDAV